MTEREILKKACEQELSFFSQCFFKVIEPEVDYIHNWHVDVISEHLEAVFYGDIKNLNINIPPRTIKSLLSNVMFPCWIWTKAPWYKIISASHSADLSTGFNMQRRQLVESPEYQDLWPISFLPDMDTQKKFGNTRGGFMQSASVGGSITGKGGDILIGDDLLDAEDAFSESKRSYANRWYSSSFYNRLQNKKIPKRINIMQRLHESDLTGHINEKYNFENLVIPMQKEEKQVQTSLGWTDPREVGEFLHPERYAQDEKDDEYEGLGEFGWAGQMQQRPVPAGGGIIKEDWIRIEDISHMKFARKLISVDATFKDSKTSDYVALGVWGRYKNMNVLIDVIKGKWDFLKTTKMIATYEEKHNTEKIIIEDKANGPAIISVLKEELVGVKAFNPKDSKEARLHANAHLFECGNVVVNANINKKMLDAYIKEMVFFPNAEHDDFVDMTTQALFDLKNKRNSGKYAVGAPLQSSQKSSYFRR